MQAKDIWTGKERTVWAICRRDRPVYEDDIYDSIPDDAKDEILVFIKRLSDTERPIRDKRLQRPIRGYENLFEMKPSGYRIFYFFDYNDVYITSSCRKKNRKENQNDYQRAHNIRLQYLRGE
jgi:mRNA-degrading endonuclease RelE of RelBE toxin-antitoxin system